MSIENMGPWKHSEEKMKNFLSDAERGENMVEKVLGKEKNEAKEKIVKNSSKALSQVNEEVLASNNTDTGAKLEDIENVKKFLKDLPHETREMLGSLRYNTWSGEDLV